MVMYSEENQGIDEAVSGVWDTTQPRFLEQPR
jgi:hypothetical protein